MTFQTLKFTDKAHAPRQHTVHKQSAACIVLKIPVPQKTTPISFTACATDEHCTLFEQCLMLTEWSLRDKV